MKNKLQTISLILAFVNLGFTIWNLCETMERNEYIQSLYRIIYFQQEVNEINIRNHQIDSTQNAKAVYSPGVKLKGVVTNLNTIE